MAKLKDIANELGLSPATVSRALNGYPEVGERTRERVREAALRLGYAPNPIARRLVGGRSGLVGMVVPKAGDVSVDPSFVEMVAGMSEALAAHDMDLVISVDTRADPRDTYKRLIERSTLDGFVVTAPLPDDPRLALLRAANIPFVVHGPGGGDDDFYDIDNHGAGRIAAEHLIGFGHRNIAFLNGPAHLAYAQDRRHGYEEAIHAASLDVNADLLWHDEPTHSTGERLADRLLDMDEGGRPTAILCSSTAIASGVYAAAERRGLSVGEDVSVMAHDDAPPHIRAQDFRPPLTVTTSPLTDACEPLAAMLAARVSEPDAAPQQIVAGVDLVSRDSTGPAR